ncbi:hypothetical protein FACS1894189_4130 [Planctomycetales bacterium]|nr:hypothetical protein FACS1894189_4130 [Planctomycetales bacterium]
MTNQKDNWSQLLDDFGIDAPVEKQEKQQEQVEVPAPVKPVASSVAAVPLHVAAPVSTGFGVGLIKETPAPKTAPAKEDRPQRQESQQEPQKKKSFFGRFPKINLFGTSAKEPLDAVVENVKSPSLSGKSFTSNKLEKAPTSRKPRQEDPEPPKPAAKATAGSDPWSVLASQVDTLAEEKTQEKPQRGQQRGQQREQQREYEPRPSRRNNWKDRNDSRQPRKSASIFDEPIPESEESLALKKLIGEQPKVVVEEIVEERRISYIDDEVSLPPKRGRGRGRDEKPQRGRGISYETPEPVAETPREPREASREPREPHRGRRDHRFAEAEPAYTEDRTERSARPGRGSRFENKPKPVQRVGEDMYEEDTMQDAEELLHRNIPSWDDAVGFLIENNIARHANFSGNSPRRGGGGRR